MEVKNSSVVSYSYLSKELLGCITGVRGFIKTRCSTVHPTDPLEQNMSPADGLLAQPNYCYLESVLIGDVYFRASGLHWFEDESEVKLKFK